MFAGSSTVALLMSGSVENEEFSVTKIQPEPKCRRKREAIGPVLQLTHLVKTSTQSQRPQNRVWNVITRPPRDKTRSICGDGCTKTMQP